MLQGLEQRLSDRMATVDTLKQQLDQMHTQFEHYQASTAAQRQEENQQASQHIARLERELNDTRRTLHDRERELVHRDTQLMQLQSEQQRLVAEFTALDEAHQSLQQECQAVKQQLSAVTETAAVARHDRDAALVQPRPLCATKWPCYNTSCRVL